LSELGEDRHRSRERALELLYEAAMKDRSVSVVLTELPISPDAYTLEVLSSAETNQESANELIGEFAIDWPLERIAIVDRLIMTIAIGEMLMPTPPPTPVILDEAVELAKVYSTDGSSSFVNGILSSIAQKVLG